MMFFTMWTFERPVKSARLKVEKYVPQKPKVAYSMVTWPKTVKWPEVDRSDRKWSKVLTKWGDRKCKNKYDCCPLSSFVVISRHFSSKFTRGD